MITYEDPGYAALAIENKKEVPVEINKKYNVIDKNGILQNPLTIAGSNPLVELVDMVDNPETGYQGYLYKNIDTGEYYLVHSGSQTIAITPNYNVMSSKYQSEVAKVCRLGFNPTLKELNKAA